MKNMRIGSRLGLGFALVSSLLVLMTIIGVWRLQDIGGRTATMIALDLQKERLASEWAANIDANGVRTIAVIKSNNADHQKFFKDQMAGTVDRTSSVQKQLDELIKSDEGRKLFDALLAQRKVYNDLRNKIIKIKESGDEAAALSALEGELIPAMKEYSARVNAVATHQRDVINRNAAIVDEQYRSGRAILIAGANGVVQQGQLRRRRASVLAAAGDGVNKRVELIWPQQAFGQVEGMNDIFLARLDGFCRFGAGVVQHQADHVARIDRTG